MRSKIAKKIIDGTSDEVKEKVRDYAKTIFYDSIELTEQELADAILEGKKRKYFHEKNKGYWESKESVKGKTKMIEYAEARKKLP